MVRGHATFTHDATTIAGNHQSFSLFGALLRGRRAVEGCVSAVAVIVGQNQVVPERRDDSKRAVYLSAGRHQLMSTSIPDTMLAICCYNGDALAER
jgi:hypothetical protein